MKIKTLLIATAAGAVGVSGAQAADLPSAPHPVDYVRVCDTYGDGFYYLPGTDTCIRLGGRVRADYTVTYNEAAGNTSNWGAITGTDTRFRSRGYVRVDTRTETEAGLLRTYIDLYSQVNSNGSAGITLESAFIQYGNWTFGRSGSVSAPNFGTTYQHSASPAVLPYNRTNLISYGMDLGNGVAATVALQDDTGGSRGAGWAVVTTNTVTAVTDTAGGIHNTLSTTTANAGFRTPELHANIRINQSWGQITLGGAVRQNMGNVAVTTAIANSGGLSRTDTFVDYGLGWGVNAGISGSIGSMSAYLAAGYGDGFTQFALPGGADMTNNGVTASNVKAMGVSAGISAPLASGITAGLEGWYASQNPTGANNNTTTIGVSSNLVWKPVSGLQFGVEGNWIQNKTQGASALNNMNFLFRAQRDY